jgi:hypothetical protein
MSSEEMVDWLAERLSRRKALRRIGGMLLGALTGALGVSNTALALFHVKCCNLVYSNTCSSLSCASYIWYCCYNNRVVACGECYAPGCGCNGNGCSIAYTYTNCPCGTAAPATPCP